MSKTKNKHQPKKSDHKAMTDSRSPTQIITDCQQAVGPPLSGAEIVKSQGAALGALMKAAGVTSCKQATVAGISLFGAAGGSFTEGCEQLAGMSSAMQGAQDIFECTMKSLRQTDNLLVRNVLTAEIKIADHVTFKNCTFNVNQVSGLRVAAISKFTEEVKQQMTSTLNSAMEGFLKNIQDEKTQGLFPSTAGQKAFQSFTQVLEQKIAQKAFQNTVQETLKEFEKTANVSIDVGPYSTLGFDQNSDKTQLCVNFNQEFMDQIVSQNILTNALEIVFNASGAADFKAVLQSGQYKKNVGLTLPDFSFIIVIVIVVIVGGIFLRTTKGSDGTPQQAGPKWLGILLMVIGILSMIAAIVVLLIILKKGWLLTGITLAGGAVLTVVGLVMFLKAKKPISLSAPAAAPPVPTTATTVVPK